LDNKDLDPDDSQKTLQMAGVVENPVDTPNAKDHKEEVADIHPPSAKDHNEEVADIDPANDEEHKEDVADIAPTNAEEHKDQVPDIDPPNARNTRRKCRTLTFPVLRSTRMEWWTLTRSAKKREEEVPDIDPPNVEKHSEEVVDIDPQAIEPDNDMLAVGQDISGATLKTAKAKAAPMAKAKAATKAKAKAAPKAKAKAATAQKKRKMTAEMEAIMDHSQVAIDTNAGNNRNDQTLDVNNQVLQELEASGTPVAPRVIVGGAAFPQECPFELCLGDPEGGTFPPQAEDASCEYCSTPPEVSGIFQWHAEARDVAQRVP
jgi:hypothetical protein